MQGNHGLTFTKRHVYEESTRVPFIVRGPKTVRGTVASEPTSNVDWAPTILRLARAKATIPLDGMSLKRYLRHPSKKVGRATFYETTDSSVGDIPGYDAVKVGRSKYVEYTSGERELYDTRKDPFELSSRHTKPAYARVIRKLAGMLAKFRTCKGRSGRNPCLRISVKAPAAP
jgi:N-acetylglucosamine-6-sulfatase